MHNEAKLFGIKTLRREEIEGKTVLEVGSKDVDRESFKGTLRSYVEKNNPEKYIGIDLNKGPLVDKVCGVNELLDLFGKESFDLIICTEVIEHIRDWKGALRNIKGVCKPGGIIFITTRSRGFPYHPIPEDFWRFEIQDIKNIFSDMDILDLEKDGKFPGVFVKLKKPSNFNEYGLNNYELYSIILDEKTSQSYNFRNYRNVRLFLLKIKFYVLEMFDKVFK
ncbi:MAG: class I SAM-dependent methyltransferase [Candidatus Aenigmatarchaeota archaeon]